MKATVKKNCGPSCGYTDGGARVTLPYWTGYECEIVDDSANGVNWLVAIEKGGERVTFWLDKRDVKEIVESQDSPKESGL